MISNLWLNKSFGHTFDRFFCLSLFLSMLFFFLPLSLSLRSLCFIGVLLTLLMHYSSLGIFKFILSEFWFRVLIAFLLFMLVSIFWSPAPWHDSITVIKKNLKYLSLPIFVAAFYISAAYYQALFALLGGLFIVCLLSISQYLGFYNNGLDELGGVFFNRIFTGLMMAYGAYLSAWLYLEKKKNLSRLWAILCVFFLFQVLYINTSRTAYIVLFLLFILLALNYCNRKQLLICLLGGVVTLPLIFYTSPIAQHRIIEAQSDISKFNENVKDTSVGFRFQLHQYTNGLIKKHPFIGNGAGSFSYYFFKEHPITNFYPKVAHPHGDYWLIATEQGLAGLGLFLLLLISFLYKSWKLSSLRMPALGVLALTVIGNFSDSLLFNSAPGYFILSILGLCLAEGLE